MHLMLQRKLPCTGDSNTAAAPMFLSVCTLLAAAGCCCHRGAHRTDLGASCQPAGVRQPVICLQYICKAGLHIPSPAKHPFTCQACVAGHRKELLNFHSHVLHFEGAGRWEMSTISEYLSQK